MENTNWTKYKIEIRERLKAFALGILSLSDEIPVSVKGKVINYQLTKSGTSTYANYRAALRARSKKEFFSKLSIAVEEADETEMWISLIMEAGIAKNDYVKKLHDESISLLKILSSMRKKLS